MSHIVNAYQLREGQCFRWVVSTVPGQQGAPMACPASVVARGRWRDGADRWQTVEACAEHQVDLERR